MPNIMDYFRAQTENPMVSYFSGQPIVEDQQQQAQPVNLIGANDDYLSAIQNSGMPIAPPRPRHANPIMQMASADQAPQPDYVPTSGSQMEADSRSSNDKLLERMQAMQEANHQNDRNMQWMSFFSKLASSKSPTLLGGLGEGAQSLTDTTGKQQESNKLLDRAQLEDQIKPYGRQK